MIYKRQRLVRSLCLSAAIAAVYAVLTLTLPVPAYGPVQLRMAEALTVLAWFCPEAIAGLTLGCFLSNLLGSPYVLDWIFGTLATFLAALWTARAPKRWMAPIPPVVCNMVHRGHRRGAGLLRPGDASAAGPAQNPAVSRPALKKVRFYLTFWEKQV